MLIVFVLLLSSCAPLRPAAPTYMEQAEAAIARQDWEVAYRFLEDGFLSSQPDIRERALALAHNHSSIVASGAQTFLPERIAKTISAHGFERGVDLEQRRLVMFKLVASQDAYAIAKSNVDAAAAAFDIERSKRQHIADEQQQKDERARDAAVRQKQQLGRDLLGPVHSIRFVFRF